MRKIIFTSRLDSDCSLGAHMLCDIAKDLAHRYGDIRIYIIGGGEEYGKISRKAERINHALNRRLIFAVGSVKNPSSYFDPSALFIGVSRSALEAMACGMPVILLGNEGYLGLLDKSKLERAIRTNLTCRCAPTPPSAEGLFNEINRFFELSDDKKAELSALSRAVVQKEFSAKEMAGKTLLFYERTLKDYARLSQKPTAKEKRRKKICLCGYYGRGNFGDEAILSQISDKIRSSRYRDAEVSVIKSKAPLEVVKSLYGADIFIFGGGSLLQNSTSSASLAFYITVIFLAQIFCKDKIMLSNGIGPIKVGSAFDLLLKNATQKAIGVFDLISVRDGISQDLLKKWLPRRKIRLIHDPALIHFYKSAASLDRPMSSPSKTGYLLFIPNARALKDSGLSVKEVCRALREICAALECSLRILIFNREDAEQAELISRGVSGCRVCISSSPQEVVSLLEDAKICISQRYHGALYSAACGAPTLAISDDPKLKALCQELGLASALSAQVIKDPKGLISICNALLSQGNESRAKLILKNRAEKTDSVIEKLLERF